MSDRHPVRPSFPRDFGSRACIGDANRAEHDHSPVKMAAFEKIVSARHRRSSVLAPASHWQICPALAFRTRATEGSPGPLHAAEAEQSDEHMVNEKSGVGKRLSTLTQSGVSNLRPPRESGLTRAASSDNS